MPGDTMTVTAGGYRLPMLAQADAAMQPIMAPMNSAAPAAPAPAQMPQADFTGLYQRALADRAATFTPEAMAEREAKAMADLAAREAEAKAQQAELDKQRKWVGLMGLGAALSGQDPSRVINPFTERRDAIAKRLQDISTMRTNLPQMLKDENTKGLMSLGDAFFDFGRGVKALQPDVADPLKSQWTADRVAAASELYPNISPSELAQRPDILLSGPVNSRYNSMLADRSGVVAESAARGRRRGAPPVGRGGSGSKTGKPNVSGMSIDDLFKGAGL